MFLGGDNHIEKQKGKRTSGFTSTTCLIQTAKMDSSV